MGSELVASLILKLKDDGSGAAARALRTVQSEFKATEKAATSSAGAATAAFRKMADARETLGIRSEHAIQREIQRTEAAYKRLASSGTASARDLARAQEVMRAKVAELNREMGKTPALAERAGGFLRGGAAAVAGYQAAKYVLAPKVQQTMAYDLAVAHASNTAFAGQSLDARRAGMKYIDEQVKGAVRTGGGTREAALGTFDKLMSSGAFGDAREAAGILPTLMKFATASNTDAGNLADIAIRAKQTFGLSNMGRALDQAMMAGQMGGFELKDMAKWLPEQMALARQSGLFGEGGFRKLLAINQGAAITTGTKDKAGNAVVNFLGKINSSDTAKDAAKLGIDLSGRLAADRAKGIDSVDSVAGMVDEVLAKDKTYQALRAKAATTKGDEQRATYEAMGDILQGKSIGKLFQDRETLMGFLGYYNNRQALGRIESNLAGAGGTGDAAHELIAGTASYKSQQLATEKAIAMQTGMDQVNPALGAFAEGLAGLYREFPTFSAAATAATTALTALAAAAGAAGLTSILTGGKAGGVGAAVGSILRAPGAAAAGAARLMAGTAGGVGLFGTLGYGVGTLANEGINTRDEKNGTSTGNDIGRLVAFVMAGLGSGEARKALEIENKIILDGVQVATAVNRVNGRESRRH